MTINVSLVIDKLTDNLWVSNITEAHTPSDMIDYINTALNKIMTQYNFPYWLRKHTLTTNWVKEEYNIPFAINTFFLKDQDWSNKDLLELSDYFEPTVQKWFSIFWDVLYTKETWTWTIIYQSLLDEVTTVNDVIDLPSVFKNVIITYASKEWFRKARNFDKVRFYDEEFKVEMNRLSAIHTNRTPNVISRISEEHNI